MFATPQRAAYAVDRHTVLRRDSINVECVVPQTNRLIAQTQHKSAGKLMDDHHVAVHVLVHYAFGAIVLDSEDRGYTTIVGDSNVRKATVIPYCGRCDILGVWHDLH
ncbi:hypothetical protein BCO9919_06595 [Burkholderia cenocepacia]|uniref:Uncharacterized protein n=1 Tax=Burkholderia cenocepacia TaxID=95486 RepID=A0A6J5JSU0_9BURK|nr:hypothetical protein BCO9919_06595 [Burkholderia cenocepacia]